MNLKEHSLEAGCDGPRSISVYDNKTNKKIRCRMEIGKGGKTNHSSGGPSRFRFVTGYYPQKRLDGKQEPSDGWLTHKEKEKGGKKRLKNPTGKKNLITTQLNLEERHACLHTHRAIKRREASSGGSQRRCTVGSNLPQKLVEGANFSAVDGFGKIGTIGREGKPL